MLVLHQPMLQGVLPHCTDEAAEAQGDDFPKDPEQ